MTKNYKSGKMDTLKKFLYAGVGMATIATEKIQATVDELVEKGKISDIEGKKIIEDFLSDSNNKKNEFEDKFKKMTEAAVEKFNFATKADFDSILDRLERIEKAVKKETKTTRAKTVKK